MRKITEEMVEALTESQDMTKSNTQVMVCHVEGVKVSRGFLFDNLIVVLTDKHLYVTNAGWDSRTTRERLNGILSHFGLPTTSIKNHILHIGDKPMSGKWYKFSI